MSAQLSTDLGQLPHPLAGGVAAIEDALDRMPVEAWDGLASTEVRSLVERMMRAEARLKAHQIAGTRVLEASGLAQQMGARSTGALLAGSFGADKTGGDRMVRAGEALKSSPRTEQAMAAGDLSQPQAEIIARAVADLPDTTTPEQRQACEDTLAGDAQKYSLKDLRSRSKRITDQFLPEPEVDQGENDSLQAQEKRAWAKSEFWMRPNGDGTTTGGFTLPDAQADMLDTAIKAVSAPRRDHLRDHPGAQADDHGHTDARSAEGDASSTIYDRELDYRTRLGMGFAEVCSRLPGHLLPGRSGLGATLMVHLDYDTLLHGIKAATLSTGTRISASQARHMACNLGIIPQVFNGSTIPVDHGHEQRFFTKAQKQDMSARDGGCTAPGCDKPPEDCEGHHWRQQWAHGATTTLADGVLICAFHHRRAHQDSWQARLGPTGHIQWKRPGDTAWQQNHRWRP